MSEGDTSALHSAISSLQSEVSSLRSEIRSVDSESRGRDREIRGELKEVQRALQQQIDQLERRVSELRDALESLMREIAQNYRALDGRVGELIGAVEKVESAVDKVEGAVDLVKDTVKEGDERIDETARTGLGRVSTGLAVVDMMKAGADALEARTSMERSVEEIRGRLEQSQVAVEKKKEEFDRHFELICNGFEKQLNIIGKHVTDLVNDLMPELNELRVDEDEYDLLGRIVRKAQTEVTSHRTRVLREQKQRIDIARLARFKDLRSRLKAFVSSDRALRIETDPVENPEPGQMAIGLPVIAVRLVAKEGALEGRHARAFCLGSHAVACDKAPEVPAELRELQSNIEAMCEDLHEEDVPLGPDMSESIRRGLVRLVERGLLDAGDRSMVEEHLERHPLHRLDTVAP